MNTPIVDFVKKYNDSKFIRAHMPGHKGAAFLGYEQYDITEIKGADALYHEDGIILESEKNASSLFGTARTVYSTEGSSQCIKAMIYMAAVLWKRKHLEGKPTILAGRNAHTAFIQAAALVDVNVNWIWPEDNESDSICSCSFDIEKVENQIANESDNIAAVYVTSPDYLGNVVDISRLAEICHSRDVLLIVDNAHGSYFKFLDKDKYKDYIHPIDAGADMCCDSAHKTLPVLTGGAYLHISKESKKVEDLLDFVKYSMALFGSTSPSYLTLQSLDNCNRYLSDNYAEKLENFILHVEEIKEKLRSNGWIVSNTDPLKLTVQIPNEVCENDIDEVLRTHNIECEYHDTNYIVLMFTPETGLKDLDCICEAFSKNIMPYNNKKLANIRPKKILSIRDAVMSPHENVCIDEALGRVCASSSLSCPPAIPIVMPGELIDDSVVNLLREFNHWNIDCVI